jgi:hypothetical protein
MKANKNRNWKKNQMLWKFFKQQYSISSDVAIMIQTACYKLQYTDKIKAANNISLSICIQNNKHLLIVQITCKYCVIKLTNFHSSPFNSFTHNQYVSWFLITVIIKANSLKVTLFTLRAVIYLTYLYNSLFKLNLSNI